MGHSPVRSPQGVTFRERLQHSLETTSSRLCIGLNPAPRLMPVRDVREFNRMPSPPPSGKAATYSSPFPAR